MAIIPPYGDPTLDAMRDACERAGNKPSERDYLGASLIGEDCSRKIWYSYKKYPKLPFKAETLWAFEDGRRTEDLLAARLRMIDGIELHTHDEHGNQFGFAALGGKFKGHCDGVIRGLKQAPTAWNVWEAKCSKHEKFEQFKKEKSKNGEKNTLKAWNANYFIQAQLYMHFLQIDRHYLIVALSGGRDVDSCRTEYQPDVAENAINKADSILQHNVPPKRISEKPDFYQCRWCDYREICHNA